MTSRLFRSFTLALCLVALGCAQPNATRPNTPVPLQLTLPGNGPLTAVAQLALPNDAARRLLAAIPTYQKADIDHVLVSFYQGSTSLADLTVTQGQLTRPFSFHHLSANTSYRIVTQAFNADGNRIDDGPTSCTTTFTTGNDDDIDIGTIKLQLKGTPFEAQTTGSNILVIDGKLIAGTPTPTPTPTPTATPSASPSVPQNSLTASTLAQFTAPYTADSLAVDGQGNVYALDRYNRRIDKIDASGNITLFCLINALSNVVLDSAGNAYTIDNDDNYMLRIAPDGEISNAFGSEIFPDASALAIDVNNNIYISDIFGHIYSRTTNGNLAGNDYNFSNSTYGPNSLARDTLGNFYRLEHAPNSRIIVGPTNGNSYVLNLTDDQEHAFTLDHPNSIALDAQGNLYVTEAGNNRHRLLKITPAGKVSVFAGSGTKGYQEGDAASAQFDTPSGVVVGPDGAVYVADTGNKRIRKLK